MAIPMVAEVESGPAGSEGSEGVIVRVGITMGEIVVGCITGAGGGVDGLVKRIAAAIAPPTISTAPTTPPTIHIVRRLVLVGTTTDATGSTTSGVGSKSMFIKPLALLFGKKWIAPNKKNGLVQYCE